MALRDLFGRRTARQVIGQAGEDQALSFLQGQGMQLVERNFRCKVGEIDLIMREAQSLVFIEVRKRAPGRHGAAADSIDARKQRRLIGAAQLFLQRYPCPPACRFDVIAIDGERIDWLRNAIEA